MDLRYTVRHFFFLNYFEDACVVSKYDLVFGCLWWGSINLSIACFGPLNSWDFCLLIQSTPGCVSDRTKTNPFNPICKPSKSMNKNATFLLLATGVPLSKIQDFILISSHLQHYCIPSWPNPKFPQDPKKPRLLKWPGTGTLPRGGL